MVGCQHTVVVLPVPLLSLCLIMTPVRLVVSPESGAMLKEDEEAGGGLGSLSLCRYLFWRERRSLTRRSIRFTFVVTPRLAHTQTQTHVTYDTQTHTTHKHTQTHTHIFYTLHIHAHTHKYYTLLCIFIRHNEGTLMVTIYQYIYNITSMEDEQISLFFVLVYN